MVESRCDLLLGEPRPIVSFDQKCDAPTFIDVARPTHRLIEKAKFLEELAILLLVRNGLRTART
jgi:hypothetical protein